MGPRLHPSGKPVYWATSVAPHIRYNSDLGAWPSSPSTMKYEHPRLACQTGTESPAAPRKMQQRRSKAELMVMKAGLAGLNATIADHGCLRRKYRSAPVGDRHLRRTDEASSDRLTRVYDGRTSGFDFLPAATTKE